MRHRPRAPAERAEASVGDDAAPLQHHHAVVIGQVIEPVGDGDHRPPGGEAGERAAEFGLGQRVEPL
uniref:hypothetical protein n=1 Tax=Acidocella sp. C78 TaxID=1671486 RepID=UPI00191BB47D